MGHAGSGAAVYGEASAGARAQAPAQPVRPPASSAPGAADELAAKVLGLTRAALLADNHFLAAAIGRLRTQPFDLQDPLATDGRFLAYDASRLLGLFAQLQSPPTHDLLHAVVHCLFLHPYVDAAVDRRLWDLACDIAAERVVAEVLGVRPGPGGLERVQVIQRIGRDLGRRPDAERIYAQLRRGAWAAQVGHWTDLMHSDSHELWYASVTAPGQGEGQGNAEGEAGADQQSTPREGRGAHASSDQQKNEWRNVATSMAVDLQTVSARRGQQLGGLVDDLHAACEKRVDYAHFLRRFAQPGEAMRVNDEEFDQVFYTYGLHLYKDVPLIEPLEYREERRIREFVIAIDTSESVQGQAVRQFVGATFDILATTRAFFEQVHVRILQCDQQVTSDERICSPAELERWGRSMLMKGGGGTDFRPAFAYVDALVEEGAFRNLAGMLYFTDGLGTYPDWIPTYPVAFVFYDENVKPEDVPPWAYQVNLDDEALRCAVATI